LLARVIVTWSMLNSMDLGNPAALISSIIIGLIGTALLIYGKKNQSLFPALSGLFLCVFPYFVASVALMWLITGGTLGGLWWVSKNG
jgi:hypothetical protein